MRDLAEKKWGEGMTDAAAKELEQQYLRKILPDEPPAIASGGENETAAPGDEIPAPGGETPAPSSEIPAPGGKTPGLAAAGSAETRPAAAAAPVIRGNAARRSGSRHNKCHVK